MSNTSSLIGHRDETLSGCAKRIEAAEAAHAVEMENIRKRHQELYDLEHPLNQALDKHRILSEAITNAEGFKIGYELKAKEYEAHLEKYISSLDSINGYHMHLCRARFPHIADSALYATHISAWITARKSELSQTEAEIKKLVAERKLSHLLPENLKHLA